MSKNKLSYIALCAILAISGCGLTSCEDYLDKSPEAGFTEEDIFGSFEKFQGFIENAYFCMADPMTSEATTCFNFGDDLLQTHINYNNNVTSDYRRWAEVSGQNIFYNTRPNKYTSDPWNTGNGGNVATGDGYSRVGYWDGGWLGIRKVNIALENLDKLTIAYRDAPLQEQKDLIEGQALMLRGYLNFQIIRVWGGMPYITRSFGADEILRLPRLTYKESSDFIEQDLLRAAELLPVSWDDTETGKITEGTNQGRLTKGAAYALLGKVMLYAGSPLMNGVSGGGYVYNKEYCEKAVKYFGEVLKLSAIAGGTTYDLIPWTNYSDNFFMYNAKIPASGKEAVLNTPIVQHLRRSHIGDMLASMGGWGSGCGPTENYVQYFGMNSGEDFDPEVYNTPSINPWQNRDPRFYKNIVTDGSPLMQTASTSIAAEFFIGGRDRGGTNKSDTGYGWKKFRDNFIYPSSASYGWSSNINRRLPAIRLADVYLMYAEAVNEAYGANVSPAAANSAMQTCTVKAWEAVKAVRDRVINDNGSPLPLPAHMYASTDILRETIRKERAVELAFEGHRWYDLRRWYVSDQPQYMKLDVLEFDKAHTYYKVVPYNTAKVFEKKHFWMPLRNAQTQIYPEFYQNPGWE